MSIDDQQVRIDSEGPPLSIEPLQQIAEAARRRRQMEQEAARAAREAAERAGPTPEQLREQAELERAGRLRAIAEKYDEILVIISEFHGWAEDHGIEPPVIRSLLRWRRHGLPRRAWLFHLAIRHVQKTKVVHGETLTYILQYPEGLALCQDGTILVAKKYHGENPGYFWQPPGETLFSWLPVASANIADMGGPDIIKEVQDRISAIVREASAQAAAQPSKPSLPSLPKLPRFRSKRPTPEDPTGQQPTGPDDPLDPTPPDNNPTHTDFG